MRLNNDVLNVNCFPKFRIRNKNHEYDYFEFAFSFSYDETKYSAYAEIEFFSGLTDEYRAEIYNNDLVLYEHKIYLVRLREDGLFEIDKCILDKINTKNMAVVGTKHSKNFKCHYTDDGKEIWEWVE